MQKLIRTADLRKALDKYNREEISYGKMVEMLNVAANKALSIGDVVQQRELLIAYEIGMHSCLESEPFRTKYAEKVVDDFISKQ
jgi:methionine salvage enolase-phosphatase E1